MSGVIESGFGRVLAVSQVDLGSVLDGDHLAGVTTLLVEDCADFDDIDGGQVVIDGTTYTYTDVDDDASTITIDPALAADTDDGVKVLLYDPLTGVTETEWLAQVTLDGDEPGDALEASIRSSLVDQLADGLRGITGEAVELQWDEDEALWLVDILGRPVDSRTGQIRFLNTDTFTATGPGDLDCPLTFEPIDGSEDVKVEGIGQAGHWTRTGRILTLLDPDSLLEDDNEITVEYAYDQTTAVAAIAPTFRDVAPQQLNGWTVPALTQPGDLLVAVAMMPDAESVTTLNGWTFAGASEYVTHTAVGPGVRTYRMEIYTVRADGSGAVPTVSNAVAQDVVCSMIAFADGGSVTAVFDTLTDGTAANAPAQDPTSLRVWGTIGNAVTITPSRGQVVLSTDYTEIDTAMSVDPDPSAAPAIASGPAGWCLASMVVSP